MAVDGEGDGDAEHGEEVREVDGAVQGVDDPGRGRGDEVGPSAAGGVGLFADEAELLELRCWAEVWWWLTRGRGISGGWRIG